MGYVRNREGLYRTGFRPVHTDPFAASQLSGLGRTPFDPEVLLGQDQPFTPGGGYGLHGLGQGPIVPLGATVQYTGTWAAVISNESPSVVLQTVVNALKQDGFSVLSSSVSGAVLGELLTGSFTVTIQLQITGGGGYSEPSDIAAIVDHEAYTAIGIMPSGSSVSLLSSAATPAAPASSLVQSVANLFAPSSPSPAAVSPTTTWVLWGAAALFGVAVLRGMDLI
jgi:hypothetical protein